MEIASAIERLFASLYPLRMPIGIGAALILAAVVVAAHRTGVNRFLWRQQRATTVAAVVAMAVLLPAGYYPASPLWLPTSLMEPPLAGATEASQPPGSHAPSTSGRSQPVQPQSGVAKRGEFVGADTFHFGSGRALIVEVAPGRHTLRLEDFSVRNGPDLYLYLSPNPAGYAPDAFDIGRLARVLEEPKEGETGWRTYRSDAHGIQFRYPAACDVAQDDRAISVGSGIELAILDSGGRSLAEFVDWLMGEREFRVEEQRAVSPGDDEPREVDYRFGGLNRFATATFMRRGETVFAWNLTAGYFTCDEPQVYGKILASFRFTE